MKFAGTLLAVADLQASRSFYEAVLSQKIKYDFRENIQFESGISLQTRRSFASMTGVEENSILARPHSGELYFETEDFEAVRRKLDSVPGLRYLQKSVEHPWGQRVTRFYDPDGNIVEVGESMESVARRFLGMGWSAEETARKTQLPLELISRLRDNP